MCALWRTACSQAAWHLVMLPGMQSVQDQSRAPDAAYKWGASGGARTKNMCCVLDAIVCAGGKQQEAMQQALG